MLFCICSADNAPQGSSGHAKPEGFGADFASDSSCCVYTLSDGLLQPDSLATWKPLELPVTVYLPPP